MTRCAAIGILLCACSTGPREERPAPASPEASEPLSLDEIAFPSYPEGTSEAVLACATDYRELAATPFPQRGQAEPFATWYAGPFQRWVAHYNAVRERCDEVFTTLDERGAEAQVMLATQSYMHQRMGQEAAPHEEEAQMFVMSRYWTLGASCTYQHCASGPTPEWARLCSAQGRMLPACPPVERQTEMSSP